MPRDPTNNFPLKSCLFGTVKLVRNADKSKFTYNGRGIGFGGDGSWSFGNDFARNVVIFGVDNSSSFHTRIDIRISYSHTDSTGLAEKNLILILVKQIQNFA